MSVIGVRVTEKYITFVSDTQLTQGVQRENLSGYKLFVTPSAVVAVAGAGLFRPIINEALVQNPLMTHSDEEIFNLCDKIHDAAAVRGFTFSDDEVTSCEVILASKNKVTVMNGYSFREVKDYTAIGIAADVAVAFLKNTDCSVYDAIRFATDSNIYCSAPYEVLVINRESGEVVVDIMGNNNDYVEDGYTSLIDYADVPPFLEDDGMFDSTPDYQVTVQNVNPRVEVEPFDAITL